MDAVTVILGVILLLLFLYKLGTRNHDIFRSRGIKSAPAVPFLGTMAPLAFRKRNIAYILDDICQQFPDERIVGMMQFQQPMIVVKDPEIIKQITVKEFDHFTDHLQTGLEKADVIFSKNLFSIKGEKWRNMRNTLSPAFTSNKLKNMFGFIDKCGEQLADFIQKHIQPGKPCVLEMKDLFTRFTNDVIATTAFGYQINSLKYRDNEFFRTGNGMSVFSLRRSLSFIVALFSPKLGEIFGLTFLTKKESEFMTNLVRDSIATREKHGIVRPDMIHLLMQARKGELKDEERPDTKTKKAELSDDDIAGQAMVFILAGFDTVSTHLSFTSFLLATNQHVQRKLQQEIDEVMAQGTPLTYETLQHMKYLDMVLSESLRIYPPVPGLNRDCSKTFSIPSDGKHPAYTVRKGEGVWIPTLTIHRNPEYYPDPEKFDPERFSDENKQNIKPYTYMPFGLGPRLCIGQRLALLEVKICLVHMLSRFNLVAVDQTQKELIFNPDVLPIRVNGNIWIGVTSRQRITA